MAGVKMRYNQNGQFFGKTAMLRRFFVLGGLTGAALATASLLDNEDEEELFTPAQKAALETEPDDGSVSHGFTLLEQENPFLKQIRRSIGFAEFYFWGLPNSCGSAVLLDNEGTLVLCGHQVDAARTYLSFFPGSSTTCTASAYISEFNIDNNLDVAFATLEDVSVIRKFGLIPITWGQPLSEIGPDQRIILAGFPAESSFVGFSFKFHATQGKTLLYEKKITTASNEAYGCKTFNNSESFRGMSGGGAFSDGKFIGIINTSERDRKGLTIGSDITPVEAIRDAYIRLFPNRAARAGVTVWDSKKLSPTRPECVFRNTIEASMR